MKLADLKKKKERLYNEWVEYYKERSEVEFESLVEYRTMQFETEDSREFVTNSLNAYLLNEVEYQLQMDKDQQYMENKIYAL